MVTPIRPRLDPLILLNSVRNKDPPEAAPTTSFFFFPLNHDRKIKIASKRKIMSRGMRRIPVFSSSMFRTGSFFLFRISNPPPKIHLADAKGWPGLGGGSPSTVPPRPFNFTHSLRNKDPPEHASPDLVFFLNPLNHDTNIKTASKRNISCKKKALRFHFSKTYFSCIKQFSLGSCAPQLFFYCKITWVL